VGQVPTELAYRLLKSFKAMLTGDATESNFPKGELAEQLMAEDRLMGVLSALRRPSLAVMMKADSRLLEVRVFDGAKPVQVFREVGFFPMDETSGPNPTQRKETLTEPPDSPAERPTIWGLALRGKARGPAAVEVYVGGQRVVFPEEEAPIPEDALSLRESDVPAQRDTEEDRKTDAPSTKRSPQYGLANLSAKI